MMNLTPEQPLYSIYGSKTRALLPKAVYLIVLACIFYLGVIINISLLDLNADQETSLKSGALILLLVLIIVGIIISYRKTQQPYLFYRNRIAQGKQTLYYLNITNTAAHTNFLDHIFKTYSIQLEKKFVISHIPENVPLSNYLQQLVEFAKKNQ